MSHHGLLQRSALRQSIEILRSGGAENEMKNCVILARAGNEVESLLEPHDIRIPRQVLG
jgi:hypothetical protein